MNPSKAKGDRWERDIVAYMIANGFPDAKRTRAGYRIDHGDIDLGVGVVIQAKDQVSKRWGPWLGQLTDQVDGAKASHGMLFVKSMGIADPGRGLAVMEIAAATRMIYGLTRAA